MGLGTGSSLRDCLLVSEEKVKKGGDNEVGMVILKEESEWNQ